MEVTDKDYLKALGVDGYGKAEGRVLYAIEQLLLGLHEAYGLDLKDENFKETPMRVVKAYREMFAGVHATDAQVAAILSKSFPCDSSEMVTQCGIRVFSVCPHHLLPVLAKVSVAYIPIQGGRVLGLSKLARLAELLARRPVLQEKMTADITTALMSLEGCIGAACFVEAQHFCMMMRGAKQLEAVTVTSSMKGVFSDEDATRAEFLSLVRATR